MDECKRMDAEAIFLGREVQKIGKRETRGNKIKNKNCGFVYQKYVRHRSR